MGTERTTTNLEVAFDGEAKASIRLQAYAEVAEKEGHLQLAKLFRAISAAERVHARNHLRLMEKVNNTQENLRLSFERERSVAEVYYPEFIKVAEQEGLKAARATFSFARDAEAVHARLYQSALSNMLADTEVDYYLCPISGFVAEGEPPGRCPICGTPSEKFILID